MNYSRVPICYFPTTTVFIDDNKRFLSNLSFKLDEKLAYLLFDNPRKALQFLNIESTFNHLTSKCLSINLELEGCAPNQHSLHVNLGAICKEIYNGKRFNEVSVVVVDYSMPNMNGLDFAKQIKNPYIKIIMLTGEADQHLAVKAFNEGAIHKFILKSDQNFEETLNQSIKELQQEFFQDITEGLIRLLMVESSNCLEDPNFRKVFNKAIKEKQVVEYYLIDTTGSFLLLDAKGEPSWLIVKSLDGLRMYYEIAADTHAPKILLEQLKKGEKIAHFFNTDALHEVNGIDWELYLYLAKPLQGKQGYFYALIDKITGSDIKRENIVSYEYYLSNEWTPSPSASEDVRPSV